MKDSGLRVVLDLTKEWNRVCDTQLITGVTVVRTEYAKQNPDVIAAFPDRLPEERQGGERGHRWHRRPL